MSVYHTNMKFDTSCNFWSDWVTTMGTLPGFIVRIFAVSVFPKDTAKHCSVLQRIKLHVGVVNRHQTFNLAVAYLHIYPLSCSAASWNISVHCLSQGHNSALCSV